MNDKLVIGMPAGSLANPGRGGNLIAFLEKSGFRTSGYEAGGPTSFTTVNFLYGWDGRPQEFGSQMGVGEIDISIAGDDWIRERVLEMKTEHGMDIVLEKVMSLQRGSVKIVGIADASRPETTVVDLLKNLCARQKLITVVAEMPYLALDWVRRSLDAAGLSDRGRTASVQKYKAPPKIAEGVLIYETWGKTEAKVKNGGADFGIEITQSGSAIKNYGLKILDTIMTSETGIWINPEARKDPARRELIDMFLLNIYGSLNAEDKVMILFNVENRLSGAVEDYLARNNLFGNEPTVNRGKTYTEYTIQVSAENPALPLARIRYELVKAGARNLDTVPLLSSIPGPDAIRSRNE